MMSHQTDSSCRSSLHVVTAVGSKLTPKRKLSLNPKLLPGTSSSSSSGSFCKTPDKFKSDENNSPLIKRKRFIKTESFSLECQQQNRHGGKYLESPQFLNDELETLRLDNKRKNELKSSPIGNSLYRRASFQSTGHRHSRSGPLSTLSLNNYQAVESPSFVVNKKKGETEKKIDDFDDEEDTEDERKIGDLEDLLFGNNNNNNNQQQPSCQNDDHHQLIKHSLEIDATCANLIGDRSKQHVLPVIPSTKHQDLQCISPETLVEVLNGAFSDQIDEFVIIDSRYPYEFDGGHIHNALNIFTKDKLYEEMFIKRLNCSAAATTNKSKSFRTSASTNRLSDLLAARTKTPQESQKRVIIIFHCEFSSERGPSLLRFLRNQDRALNQDIYPYLHYPELYLLEGGYKSFYENFKHYCDPQTYKPMLHAEHLNDLKHFRAKAKSWEVSRLPIINKKAAEKSLRKQVRSNLFDAAKFELN